MYYNKFFVDLENLDLIFQGQQKINFYRGILNKREKNGFFKNFEKLKRRTIIANSAFLRDDLSPLKIFTIKNDAQNFTD